MVDIKSMDLGALFVFSIPLFRAGGVAAIGFGTPGFNFISRCLPFFFVFCLASAALAFDFAREENCR